MNLKQMNLGQEGLAYVASRLTGELGLCAKLSRQLERGGGVLAPLPATTSPDRALQFKAGGLMSWGETCVWFEREIEQLSGRTANGSLVFQDVWFRAQDTVGEEHNGLYFDGQSNVYYILGPHEINAAAISETILGLKSFQLVAVFCNFSFSAADVPTTRILDETLIEAMASSAQEVFVSAYDREGLVVWRRA